MLAFPAQEVAHGTRTIYYQTERGKQCPSTGGSCRYKLRHGQQGPLSCWKSPPAAGAQPIPDRARMMSWRGAPLLCRHLLTRTNRLGLAPISDQEVLDAGWSQWMPCLGDFLDSTSNHALSQSWKWSLTTEIPTYMVPILPLSSTRVNGEGTCAGSGLQLCYVLPLISALASPTSLTRSDRPSW